VTLPAAHRLVDALHGEAAPDATDVLVDAFSDYPVMRHILADADERYHDHLRRLIGFFVAARFERRELVLGISDDRAACRPDGRADGRDRLGSVALVIPPDPSHGSSALDALREGLWRELGTAARARYDALGPLWAALDIDLPCHRVTMLGTRGDCAGRGLAGTLLDDIARRAAAHPTSRGIFLTTEHPPNVSYYERRGFEVLASTASTPTITTWALFRPTPSAA
jgi:GNAT superfamily N-acetyltransferase